MAIELMKSAALLLALSMLQGFVVRYWRRNELIGQVASGLVFGAIGIAGMMTPIEFTPGVLIDSRTVVLSMAGLFGGPVTGAIAGVMAGGFRLWLGGAGSTVGFAWVVSSVLLGLAYWEGRRKGWLGVGFLHYLVFGVLVQTVCVILLLFLPSDVVPTVMAGVSFPLVVTLSLATAVLGLILQDVEGRIRTEAKLVESEQRFKNLFASAEVSIWNEDFSEVCDALDRLAREGVTDLRTYMAANRQMAWELAAKVKVRGVNAATLKLFGAESEEQFINSIGTTFGPGAIDTFIDEILAIWDKKDSFRAEAAFRKLNGEPLTAIVSMSIPRTREGFRSVPVSFLDISLHKKQEEELLRHREHLEDLVQERTSDLEKAKQEAETANRTKSAFLANMSHELRTPLNAILGFSQLMDYNPKEPLTPSQKECTGNVISAGLHLLELVNDVLDLAKIEADKAEIILEDVHLSDIVTECLDISASLGKPNGITFVNNTEDHVVQADATRLKQVLLNLLSNAVKYNRAGGTVTLDTERVAGGILRIIVTDTGIGIPRGLQARVFEPFNRLNFETAREVEGTGIGLTVVKRLMDRMGGRVGFESEEGFGSAFWVEIPLSLRRAELTWSERLQVGVEAIDEEHRKLIALLNKAGEPDLDQQGLNEVFEGLIAYTRDHFGREEKIMEACSFPDLEAHREAHRRLTSKAELLAKAWRESGDPAVVRELRYLLRTWLRDHIGNMDQRIALFAKGREEDIARALGESDPAEPAYAVT